MKKILKIIIGAFAGIGILYAIFAVVIMTGVWPSQECTVYPVLELSSPGGSYEAKYEQQRCSPKNRLEAIVWIHNNKTKLTWSVFTARSEINSTRKNSGTSGVTLNLKWVKDNILRIEYPAGTKVTQKLPPVPVNGVTILYSEGKR